MKKTLVLVIQLSAVLSICSCESYLDDIKPDDTVFAESYWSEAKDADMVLNGTYAVLRNTAVYGYGGGMDACTPNAYQWAHWEGKQMQIGDGSVFSGTGGLVENRWKMCYTGIDRANFLLKHIDRLSEKDLLSEETKRRIVGEGYFLRAVYYDLLARTYGGVPIFHDPITSEMAFGASRTTIEKTWEQVHSDFDEAIKRLSKNTSKNGQATLGAAYGMKMKAYLYTNEWDKVLEYCDSIDGLSKYKLYPSYQGLFQYENEGNEETLFAVSFMSGPLEQGSVFDRFWQCQNLKHNMNGSNSVAPTQLLVSEYETLDGSPIDPNNPYKNRDPRLDFTVLRPGAYFQGQLYPVEIKNHTGQKVGFGIRKYTIETMEVVEKQSPLDFMILRYGDVLLCRAEALIESTEKRDIPGAIALINRIRTERNDVKMPPIPLNTAMSPNEARKVLRHERRIELALEGQFWDDIKRWNAGPEYYPCDVIGSLGEKIQTKFSEGYNLGRDNLLPISNSEISLVTNLKQNPKY